MSEVTLSKAVRSNLLNLQSTATLLSKSQERLSSGLRVNSALDNPTNFFTAQGLNSRANDLSQLADAVSNAVQTVAAADKGISAITKLVESAQATARQALQTAQEVSTTTAATAGRVTAGAFTTLDVSGTASAPTSAVVQGSGFTAMTLSAGSPGDPGSASTVTAANDFTDIDLSDTPLTDTFTFDIGLGADTFSISLTAADGGLDETIDIDEAILAIQAQLDAENGGLGAGITVGKDGDKLTFTADAVGATALTIDNVATNAANADVADLGIDDPAGVGQTDTGTDLDPVVPADTLSFSLTVGADTENITIDSATGDGAGTVTAQEVADAINTAFGSTVATVDGDGELVITNSATGTGSTVSVGTITATGAADASDLGLGAGGGGAVNGSAAGTAASVSFSVNVDGAGATPITLSAASIATYNAAHTSATVNAASLSAANVASVINYQAGATVASVGSGGALEFTSSTTGTTSTVAITGFASAGAVGGSSGIADNSGTGAASSTTTVTNPKRAELVSTYNDLLGQIDALAKDASFNGVNLLANDKLSVLFNEDGSSKIDIQGVDDSSTGLGLSQLTLGTEFDTNAGVNNVLDTLKSAIDTLRSQSAKFGSNLSVVETRQDFTKQMINVLQTGAANLTLADTNEEAANVLALQTRQQLSSTALSLASQADQNVLRLF